MFWFESRKSKERKSRFSQLVDMALADGELDPAEQDLLEAVAEGLEISPEEFDKILTHPERIPFTPPYELDDRLLQFAEIVDMMGADEKIVSEEHTLALKVAGRLGIPPHRAPALIDIVLKGIDDRTPWDSVMDQMKSSLRNHN